MRVRTFFRSPIGLEQRGALASRPYERLSLTGRDRLQPLIPLWVLAVLIVCSGPAAAVCVPFPCLGCWITNSGQLNLVVLDRARGEVRLVPNIRFVGDSPELALVVPTPGFPELAEAPPGLWPAALELTQPAARTTRLDGFGCTTVDVVSVAVPEAGSSGDGVIVHSEETVGAFQAFILSSSDADTLVGWLSENGFSVAPADARRFEPLIADGWYFTAMKLDTTLVTMPPDGWNADVDPIELRWDGDRFEVPLSVLAIHRADWLPMTFFVLDSHRTTLAGFDTRYANRISASEAAAIRGRYPNLGSFLGEGSFLTRLDRTFTTGVPMEGRLLLERAPTDDEFRLGATAIGVGPAGKLPPPIAPRGASPWLSSWVALVGSLAAILYATRALAALMRAGSPSPPRS